MASRHFSINRLTGVGYVWRGITLDEGLLLRAVAICMILAHNYLHWLADRPGENEFSFWAKRMDFVLDGLRHTPWDAVRLLASYFGHYGVQVFFFLSGYGLTVRYGAQIPRWWQFQMRRWKAFYPAVVLSALGYLVYEGYRQGWAEVWYGHGVNLIRQMIGVSNFIPDNVYDPIGPWWFIGVILQFYLVLPLVWRALARYGDRVLYVLLAMVWVLEYAVGSALQKEYGLNINHTILGHLDVCMLGMWVARRERLTVPWWVLCMSVVLFVVGNFYYVLWIPSGFILMLFLLPLLRVVCACAARSRLLGGGVMMLGQLSVYLFLCNGYLRRPLIEWAKEVSHWWTSIWTCLVFIMIVVLWAMLLRGLERGIFLVLHRRKL